MVRKLAVAAFALSALSSGVAQALGLGEATVQSALNQPLTAEIELVNIRELEKNEILTGLADRDEFTRAGLERVFFLSDLRFRVEVNEEGNAVIKITSSRPVREPFLNFLVEVNWPSGRLLREYALLIDPPAFGSGTAAPVQLVSTPENDSDRAPAEITPQQAVGSQQTQVIPGVPTAPLTSTDLEDPPEQTNAARAETYGPTRANDTMWSIALKTRPDSGISPQKMMLAIQDLNPDAFIDSNVNQLKRDQVLTLPSEEQINVRSSRQAIAEFKAQTQQFEAGKKQALVAANGESSAGKDELRIIVDEGSGDSEINPATTGVVSRGTGDSSNPDIALAREQLDLSKRENEDLKSRLSELEEQLETMQRLVALKDDQLAVLQGDSQDQQSATVPGTEELGPDDQQANSGDGLLAESRDGAEQIPGTETVTGMVAGEPEANQAESGQSTAPATEGISASASEASAEAEEAPPSSTFAQIIDNVKNNTLYQGALAGGGVLALLLVFFASRRKNLKAEDAVGVNDDDLGIPAGNGDSDPFDKTVAIGAPGSQSIDGEVSDPIAEAEVYVAYQKYSQAIQVLEDAAEQHPQQYDYQLRLLEVLGESRKATRFAAVLGTLEASGDAGVLERTSEIKTRFSDLLGGADISMDELETQLLGGDDVGSDQDMAKADISDDFELDVDMENSSDLDESIASSEEDADFIETNELDLKQEVDPGADDDLDIEFDLSDLDLDDADEEKQAEESVSDIAFDDSDLDIDDKRIAGREDIATAGESLESAVAFEDAGKHPGDSLDDEFADLEDFKGLGEQSATADSAEASGEADDNISLDLDQEDLDFSLDDYNDLVEESGPEGLAENDPEVTVKPHDNSELLADNAPDSADKSSEGIVNDSESADSLEAMAQSLPGSHLSPAEDRGSDMEEDFDFLSDTDEAATKLDLARAYVDMGDSEGARDILEEVAEEGSDDQKNEARELLKGLG